MDGVPVKVYVYDISQGLARTWSQALLGKHLDGVWHTGIVCYGDEFFFGGHGIDSCPPGHTILGQPDQIYDMGLTHIPREIFMDYLQELGTSTYRPECYSLFEHNCNNFSSEVSQFLTGQEIPDYITNLPAEVLETQFGQMIRPMIDSVKVTPEGGSHLFSRDTSPAESSSQLPMTNGNTRTNGTPDVPVVASPPGTVISGGIGERWIAQVDFIKTNSAHATEALKSKLTSQEVQVMTEFIEYLLTPVDQCSWSVGPVHVQLACSTLICHHKDLDSTCLRVIINMLHQAVVRPEIQHVVNEDKTMCLAKVLSLLHKLPPETHHDLAVLLTNASYSGKGHRWLTDTKRWPDGSSDLITCELVVFALTTLLRLGVENVIRTSSMAVLNLACRPLESGVAEKLGLWITECLTKRPEPQTAENCLRAWKLLLPFMEKSAMGRVDIKEVHLLHIAAQSKKLNDLCVEIRRTMDRILNGHFP